MIKGNSFFHSDLKVVVLVLNAPASLERFAFFLLGLSDLDDSAISKFCFEYFSKDSYLSKNVVSKNKANCNVMLLVDKEKKFNRLLKSISQNFLFKKCASLIEALQHKHF